MRLLVAALCLAGILATQLGVVVSAVAFEAVHDCECLPEMCHCNHDGAAACHRGADEKHEEGCTETGDQFFGIAWDAPPALEIFSPVETASRVTATALGSIPPVVADLDTLPPRPLA